MLNYAQILGDIVKNARLQLGLTQSQLAEQVEVDVRTILNILQSGQLPDNHEYLCGF